MRLKQSWKLVWLGVCALLFLLVFFFFQGTPDPSWRGTTMGTTYSITLAGRVRPAELRELKSAVDERLAEVNTQMSTWDPNSEISQFNGSGTPDGFPVSAGFSEVIRRALEISAATDGAFDPTVKPLVDYWGFGPGDDETSIEEIMKVVGWRKFSLKENILFKSHPEIQLDLSAIAKGYGVDAVAAVIQSSGHENFLVEVGGEVVASGLKSSGDPWRIGIESPEPDVGGVFRVVNLSGRALATSGDYRNFREHADGSRYSHIINPKSGHPAETDVASVSVLTSSCMTADAAATALCVMGSKKGLLWAESVPGLEAMFILHALDRTFTTLATSGFPE